MSRIKSFIERAFMLANTCANGHKSVIMTPDGKQKCMDCGLEW